MSSFTRTSFSEQSVQTDLKNSAHAAYSRKAGEPMGSPRTLGTVISILLGLTLCYAGLHYVPTLLKPAAVVDSVVSPAQGSQLDMDRDRVKRVGAYAQNFFLRRTYLRAGQGLQVNYDLPVGTELELQIRQCRRLFIIEVFHCHLVSEETITISNRTEGRRGLRFPEAGFYHFSETVRTPIPGEPYQVIWSRG